MTTEVLKKSFWSRYLIKQPLSHAAQGPLSPVSWCSALLANGTTTGQLQGTDPTRAETRADGGN